ncbi:MAG: hypothetical protein ACTSU2_14930 [Promethearchaeota archaeon]
MQFRKSLEPIRIFHVRSIHSNTKIPIKKPVAFSEDGKLLAIKTDPNEIQLWDMIAGKLIKILRN